MENKIYDIIVIGAGPAGMTAALYAKRNNKDVLILEKEAIGGQMALAPKIENYPSITSISGENLASNMFDQIMDMGVMFELEKVEKVTKENNIFTVTTDYNSYLSYSVIVATGAHHKMIGIPNEKGWLSKGLSYCATCDGSFFKDEVVAVIGDGNSALQYALQLSDICQKVYVCTLFEKFFGDSILVERLASKDNIDVINRISLKNIKGCEKIEELIFENLITHDEFNLKVDGCFIAIGQEPDNRIIKNLVELDKVGYVITSDSVLTKTDGLFVAGDCRTKKVRQVTTAISDGAVAAIEALNYLNQ